MKRTPVEQSALDHVWVHAMQYADLEQEDGLKVFVRGEGSTLYDARGRAFLDGMAGLCIVNVGHGRAEIAEAMAAQARQLAYVSSFNHVALPTVQLAEKLATLTPPGLDRVFFCSGGSEAVETALKMARQYHALNGEPQRQKFISRQESYHGATYGAMSVSGRGRPFLNRNFGPLLQGTHQGPQPFCFRCPLHLSYPACGVACADAVEDIIRYEGPETIAAIIAEPISFSAGIAVPPAEYWPKLRELCDRYGILLIADEVITGFGRTGRWFGLEHFAVTPDMITLAKGFSSGYAPLGACVVKRELAEAFVGHSDLTFRHGYSYGGHAVSAAAGLKNIEVLEREDLAGNAARMGARLGQGLANMARHPSVGDVRGIGLMWAVELVVDQRTRRKVTMDQAHVLDRHLMQLGLLTRCWDILYFAPPLCITPEEVDQMLAITDVALGRFEDDLGLGLRQPEQSEQL